MGPAKSTPAFNVAFINGSVEEPHDLVVPELCQRTDVAVGNPAFRSQVTKGCRQRLVVFAADKECFHFSCFFKAFSSS